MTGGRESERRLLIEILARIEELSEARHRMAREHRILLHAATELRMGRDGDAVLADIASRARRSPSARCRRRSARWAG
jgi:hypothetical protein